MKRLWGGWAGWISAVLALAVLVTLAVVSTGFDSQETPREDPSVWVMRSGGQYARVNTETAEIDTVRVAESPSALVQTDGLSLLLTQGFGRASEIDPSNPRDVRDDDGEEATEGIGAIETPLGTREVLAAGGRVLYLTESGQVFLASSARPESTIQLDTRAEAAAMDGEGRVAVYSRAEGGVRWFDGASGEARRGVQEIPRVSAEDLPGESAQIAIVDGEWVILDGERQVLHREGGDGPLGLDLGDGALLQGSSEIQDRRAPRILIADSAGLIEVGDDGAERIAEASGIPARPQASGDGITAAWIGASAASLWRSGEGLIPLDFDVSVDQIEDPLPVISTNGERSVLVETSTGMLWRGSDGRSIPVSQWNLADPPNEAVGSVVTQDVTEQEPPVAVDDHFGVRAGEPALLPVLLNDYDPNRKDVLTVVPDGLGSGLSSAFGDVELLANDQGLVLRASAAAVGTATFRYRITDGVHLSAPASVTVTVIDPDQNSAPQWCPVDGCQRAWPSPEVTPGGTLVMPLLEGWVDPEGDPMTLVGAEPIEADAPLRVLITEDGRLALRHTDANAGEGDHILRVSVSDTAGATTERELRVQVNPNATAEFAPMASTIVRGETTTLSPLGRVTGGSGAYALVDAVVQSNLTGSTQGRIVQPRVKSGSGTIELTADREGSATLAVTLRDTVTAQEISGVIRVTVVQSRLALSLPPMRAFVRPLSDSTVDVLSAVPNAQSRAISVQSATVLAQSLGDLAGGSSGGASLRADVIEHSRIRVSGSTADGRPGRIGSVDVTIAEGEDVATGRVTVFQVSEAAHGAIAVADTAVVRAGSVVDIPVLANDISAPGERLLLTPEVTGSGTAGELAFASGSRLRYLAPNEPGTYILTYRAYGAGSPELSDTAQVRVTVLPAGGNRNPEPGAVTVYVAPGEQASATIPLSGVDPDGDRVRLVSVAASEDPQVAAAIEPRSSGVEVSVSRSAEPGTRAIPYTVRDDFGGEGTGILRVIVVEPDPAGGGPVAYSDYARIAMGGENGAEGAEAGAPATEAPVTEVVIRPLDNDLDPSGGNLEIIKVVPNVAGSTGSAEYLDLARRLDVSDLRRGIVRVTSADRPNTVSYRYTVRSTTSTSTADGLIVVQTTRHVGQQAPNVTDTVLSVKDRSALARTGIDVVSGRVRWATGDVAQLKLSLWGTAADRYRVDGNSIIGPYRAEGDLIPFKLSGTDASGAEVEGFGFLIVPPLDELRLTLKPGLAAITVNEGESVDVGVEELVDLGPGDRVELAPGEFPVQRGQASCRAIDEQTIRYSAGARAPWSDSCTIRVRLTEQRSYTSLAIRVNIVPDQPVAVLNPLTRTVSPGASSTIDLLDMVEWQGGREGDTSDLGWVVTGGGDLFDLARSGSELTVRARADAAPGLQEILQVTVSGGSSSRLTLRVGEAARDAPRGAAVSLSCMVGSPCATPLVGLAGEYDPFDGSAGSGLHVVTLDGAGCAVAQLRADGDTLRVAWPDDRGPGGTCTAIFTVRDAQDRTGTGTIELDARGVPRAPASAVTVATSESSATVRVTPGEAAHPAVSGIVLKQVGTDATTRCTPDGSTFLCELRGLTLGEQRSYVAVAMNEVGESAPSTAVTTWAFRPPAKLPPESFTAEQVPGAGNTTESRGTVRFVINGPSDVKEYRVLVNDSVFATLPGSSVDTTVSMPVGAHSYRVVPVSRFSSPIEGGVNTGEASAPKPLTVAGLPVLNAPLTSYDPVASELTVTVRADANRGGTLHFGAAIGESCTVTAASDTFTLPLSASDGQTVRVTVCARNDWGVSNRTTDIIIEVPESGGTP